jgi:nicotinate-nucleotide--dimethylbenzimidazole phosphoribosyltransferase
LTKPPGALGRLEDLALWVAGWQGTGRPRIAAPQVLIFAGNHGVCAQGVSAFPPEVTVQMVANFKAGGAAINQLSKTFGVAMAVHALELDRPTADFTQSPAMTEAETVEALLTGWNALDAKADLLVVGEMGIGNTTVAAAIAAALLGGTGAEWVGRGTGVDNSGLARKAQAVDAGLALHASRDPLQVLACLGGREIAAMAGAMAPRHSPKPMETAPGASARARKITSSPSCNQRRLSPLGRVMGPVRPSSARHAAAESSGPETVPLPSKSPGSILQPLVP